MIRFLLPLIVSFAQIDFALKVIEEAILASGGSLIETQESNNEWTKHFIQVGQGGVTSL